MLFVTPMSNEESDQLQIRAVIAAWLRASAAHALDGHWRLCRDGNMLTSVSAP
ncbi:hypothetical protein BH09VER1_BH09VER1_40190 [soil metagenome]